MILTNAEYKDYLEAHLHFLFFAGLRLKLIPKNTSFETFLDIDLKIKFKCRQAIIEDASLLEDYLKLNNKSLTENQINILNGFKKCISGKFIIYKCLTNYAIFINAVDNKFYAVKALGDSFEDFFSDFPVLVQTTILPFNNKIIYDGFFETPVMYIGSNMTKSFDQMYRKAKKQKKILMYID